MEKAIPALVKNGKILPIFEPVKVATGPLINRAKAFAKGKLPVAVVVNPQVGELAGNHAATSQIISDMRTAGASVVPALVVDGQTTSSTVQAFRALLMGADSICLHADVAAPTVATLLQSSPAKWNLFFDGRTSATYQGLYPNLALLRDSFSARATNASYPPVSFFSDAHLTYKLMKHFGFADYTVTGSQYTASGGPAYAVAIHMTEDRGASGIFCNHFISVTNATPANPAGKFGEALKALVTYSVANPGRIDFSLAFQEFLGHHTNGHFPGLGEVKRLSIQHHLELMAKLV